jgi:DNA-binding MarR family transcriptional regulator
MHHTAFALKRAHLASLRVLRPIAACHDLTPARFDVLNAILTRARGPNIVPFQAEIARALGVTRSTICKMVIALEKAGFVTRCWASWDQRCRRVKLTPYGRRCALRMLKTIRRRLVERPLLRSLARFWTDSRVERELALYELSSHASRLWTGLSGIFGRELYRVPARPVLPKSRARRSSRL